MINKAELSSWSASIELMASGHNKVLYFLFCFSVFFISIETASSAASVSVKVSAPSDSAASAFSSKITNNLLYSPCLSQTMIDDAAAATIATTTAQTTLDDANKALSVLSDTDAGYASAESAVSNAELALVRATTDSEARNAKITIGSELIDNYFDRLTITISASNEKDSDENFIYDLYFMFVELNSSTIFLFERQQGSSNNLEPISARIFSDALDADNKMGTDDKKYLPKTQFAATDYKEEFLGNVMFIDAYQFPQGPWMVMAILDGDNNIKLDDPNTWEYWDTDIFILGTPFKSSAKGGTSGNGICQ